MELLQKSGYTYLTQSEVIEQLNKANNVILEDILLKQFPKINKIKYLGEKYTFEPSIFIRAVEIIKDFPLVVFSQVTIMLCLEKEYILPYCISSNEVGLNGTKN
ncbi:MAG: hypothetical protein KAU83_07925 [Bacteroidales bacterium]|nr:hypothetical protein [Bacteroidales bacterium]